MVHWKFASLSMGGCHFQLKANKNSIRGPRKCVLYEKFPPDFDIHYASIKVAVEELLVGRNLDVADSELVLELQVWLLKKNSQLLLGS